MRWQDIVAASILIPVVSLAAVWAFRHIGTWLLKAISATFGQVVLEVMAPDMAHLSTKVSSSLDELRYTNTAQHDEVQGRLGSVEVRLTEVEGRLAHVESKLNIRPPGARTRATDQGEETQ